MSKAQAKTELDRALALDIVRVTEATAVAAALWRGRGNEAAADEAAAAAMYRELARLPIEGVVEESEVTYFGTTNFRQLRHKFLFVGSQQAMQHGLGRKYVRDLHGNVVSAMPVQRLPASVCGSIQPMFPSARR